MTEFFDSQFFPALFEPYAQNDAYISLQTDIEKYDEFRTLLRTAQKNYNSWLEEPEESLREELEGDVNNAWQTLQEWLVGTLASGDWNPEWLAWLIYTTLFDSPPWERLLEILKLTSLWARNHKSPEFIDEKAFKKSVGKLDMMLGDSAGEPLIKTPLGMIPLVANKGLTDLSLKCDGAQKEAIKKSLKSDDITSLVSLAKQLTLIRDELTTLTQEASRRGLTLNAQQSHQLFADIVDLLSFFSGQDFTTEPEPATPEPPLPEPSTEEQSTEERTTELKKPAPASPASPSTEPKGLPEGDYFALGDAPIKNRDQARAHLKMLTDYFQATEPLSPLPFLLEKALRWSGYTLPQLLEVEFQQDTETRQKFCAELGLEELAN